MDTIALADAKAHLSELVDQVEAGASIDIAREAGRLPGSWLLRSRASRSMRDGDRY